MHYLIEFDFTCKKFNNPVAMESIVNELIIILESNKLNKNEAISNDFKTLILAVNSVIDYLLNENGN